MKQLVSSKVGRMLIIMLIIAVNVTFLIYVAFESEIVQFSRTNFAIIISAIILGIGITIIIARFLDYNGSAVRSRYDIPVDTKSYDFKEILKSLNDLHDGGTYENRVLSKFQIADIENNLKKSITTSYDDELKTRASIYAIEQPLNKVLANSERYLIQLSRNSIINLLVGIIGTVAALSVLGYTILHSAPLKSVQEYLPIFLPRLTFIVFVQIFSFFSLRLYKGNLEDIKYFQNEYTNLNVRFAALNIAKTENRVELIDGMLRELSLTERNFKLAKDESLQIIEKAKIENGNDVSLLNAIAEIVKSAKK